MSETPNTYITLKEEAKSRDNLQDLIQPQQEEYHKTLTTHKPVEPLKKGHQLQPDNHQLSKHVLHYTKTLQTGQAPRLRILFSSIELPRQST